jgi:glycine C-acetyltransferase
MSFNDRVSLIYQQELNDIREAGLFKQERFIHSPQAADIEVEFPTGASIQKVINICANNYLGLSSHPEVLEAAHEGLTSVDTVCRLFVSFAAPRIFIVNWKTRSLNS